MHKIALSLISIVALQSSASLFAAEYVGIRVDAENYTDKSDEWYLTSPDSIPDVQPDPDGPHTADASNGAYMELLPDTRVTHLDELVSGGNFWGGSGGGPRLEYLVDVPEAGTYTVWVKMYATGTEDNGIHVGINGTTPQTGEKIQLCGGKNRWSWTSNQRTDENHCGVTQTISLEVPTAGPNTIIFYAREDGFEIDQFLLLKETNPDAEDCYPLLSDRIRCVDQQTGDHVDDTDLPLSLTIDGNTSTIDPNNPVVTPSEVDLSLDMDEDSSSIQIETSTNVTLEVENVDDITATGVAVNIDLPDELGYEASGNCTENNNSVTCQLGDISSGETVSETIQLTGLALGQHRIDATVSSDLVDPVANNNSESLTIAVTEAPIIYDAAVQTALSTNATSLNGSASYQVTLTNLGMEAFPAHTLSITHDDGISVTVAALNCTQVTGGLNCDVPQTENALTVSATVTGNTAGTHSISAAIDSQFDEVDSNNSASDTLSVITASTIASTGGAMILEAEHFAQQTPSTTAGAPAWNLISANAGTTPQPDPDNASPAATGGGAYMEILPDRRVAGSDDPIVDISNFATAGGGASLQYPVFITEAGRYYVHALIRANGDQDNTLHFGLNDTWPSTGSSVSLCSPTGDWQWASATEIDERCDTTVRPYLDISEPGFHTLSVSQSEDGLELDRLYLTLSDTDQPIGIGSAPVVYDNPDIDLQTTFRALPEELTAEEAVTLVLDVTNNNTVDTAVNVELTIDGLGTLLDAGFQTADNCSRNAALLVCQIQSIAPGATQSVSIEVTPMEGNSFKLSGTVESAHTDTVPANNNASTEFEITTASSGGGSMSILSMFLLIMLGALGSIRGVRTQLVSLSNNCLNPVRSS
jgi:hypothetical protein